MSPKIKVKDVVFEVEVDFDRDMRIENMAVTVEGSDQELGDVLSEKVLHELEEKCYAQYEGPEVNEDDPSVDR
jgi:hypothetical protein